MQPYSIMAAFSVHISKGRSCKYEMSFSAMHVIFLKMVHRKMTGFFKKVGFLPGLLNMAVSEAKRVVSN